MKPIFVMLDLETWGTRAGCDIRSIGATVFDPVAGTIGTPDLIPGLFDPSMFYIAVDNPQYGWNAPKYKAHGSSKYPLHRDPETVKWWSDQSPEAQAAFADPVDLRMALIRFADWLDVITVTATTDQPQHRQHVRLYAHGPQFDGSILEAAYHACQLPVPWHYRGPRDTRTVFDIAGIEDHSGFMGMFSTGTHHHALDDAISQARAVCAAFKVIKGNNPCN